MAWCPDDLSPDDLWDPFAVRQELTAESYIHRYTYIGILCMGITPI